jgi:hypothetical protein
MRISPLSVVIGILFAACGVGIGLSAGGLLVWLDWLADPGRGRVFLALMSSPAILLAGYGFASVQRSLQKQRSIKDVILRLALLSAIACGGLFLKAASVIAPAERLNRSSLMARQDHVVVAAACLLGLGFLSSLISYWVFARALNE